MVNYLVVVIGIIIDVDDLIIGVYFNFWNRMVSNKIKMTNSLWLYASIFFKIINRNYIPNLLII